MWKLIMPRKYITFINVILVAVFFSNCSSSLTRVGPSNYELQKSIASSYCNWNDFKYNCNDFEVSEVSILNTENTGNSVEENIVGRFTARLTLKIPLYKKVADIEKWQFIEETTPSGFEKDVSGVFYATVRSATKSEKKWRIIIDTEISDRAFGEGFVLKHFNNPLIRDTDKANKIILDIKIRHKEAKEKNEREKQAWLREVSGKYISKYPLGWGYKHEKKGYIMRQSCGGIPKGEKVYTHMKISIPNTIKTDTKTKMKGSMYIKKYPHVREDFEGDLWLLWDTKRGRAGKRFMYFDMPMTKLECETTDGRILKFQEKGLGFYGKAGGVIIDVKQTDTFNPNEFEKLN